MTALFTSFACDWCDGLAKPKIVDRGYVVWQTEHPNQPQILYVFPSVEMALYYQRVTGAEGEIREVLSETRINWGKSGGSIRNLVLADRLFSIYPDWRFEPGHSRAYLSPEDLGSQNGSLRPALPSLPET